MRQTEFQIGDRCLFTFRDATGIPVEVLKYHEEFSDCLWVSPDDPTYRMSGVFSKMIRDRYAIATNICYLKFVERTTEVEDINIDISTLI